VPKPGNDPRYEAVAAWLSVPASVVATLPDAVVDAVMARMAGREPGAAEPAATAGGEPSVDELTGLLSRSGIEAAAAEASRRSRGPGRALAVIVCHLDDLGPLTEREGPGAADTLLYEVGQRLRAAVRRGDYAGRWSDTEFLVLYPEVETNLLALIRDKLRRALDSQPVRIGERVFRPALSMAWATATGEQTLADLVRIASEALPAARLRSGGEPGLGAPERG
jgi:diguanylate cyclase (GGDEF)-like protein